MAFQFGAFQIPGFQTGQVQARPEAGSSGPAKRRRKLYVMPDETVVAATEAEIRQIAELYARNGELIERATNELAGQTSRKARRVVQRIGEALKADEPLPQALLVDIVLAWLSARIPDAPELIIAPRTAESILAEWMRYAEAGITAMRYRRAVITKAIEKIVVATLLQDWYAARGSAKTGS